MEFIGEIEIIPHTTNSCQIGFYSLIVRGARLL